MKLARCILFLFSLVLYLQGNAQQPLQPGPHSNLRTKKIPTSEEAIQLDSLSIVPNTLAIDGISDTGYTVDYVKSIFSWKVRPEADSVTIRYRVFPFRMNAVVQRLDFDSVARFTVIAPLEDKDPNTTKGVFNFGTIDYNGSFGRGISFGNNQSAVVNSNFNLQLNGMLADSIEIAAAITDNNIPIQPDGTTQQLNEFDQVFLQFKKKNWQLSLGDIDIRQNELYFLNFYKRLQGISFQTKNRLSNRLESSTLVSGSIAKGKFNRNVFQGLEGNQGPYRLSGANNEFFFIVLSGTERVFVDGELLQRGEDQDYVINYNTAEVTFTPRRMITKDSRIQIEFEYADRNYLNANLFAYQTIDVNRKLKIKVGAFNNSDARNSPINQTLDSRQKQFLFDVGDSINKAFYPTAGVDSFSTTKILYEKVYFNSGSVVDSFYRYSTDPALAKYSLSFTELGQGRGNYVADFNGANGKVFRFVEPVNGAKLGRFEPVAVLVTPKKQQLISVGTDYQVDKNNSLRTEFALSNHDVNTYSSKDAGDDAGLAARVQYTNESMLNKKTGLQLTSTVDLEHVDQKFKPLERLRHVEFTREWGLPLLVLPASEDIVRLGTKLKNKRGNGLTYQFMNYRRSDQYKGNQNLIQHSSVLRGWTFNNQLSLTNYDNADFDGKFLRPTVDISKVLKKFHSTQVGVRYALEQNEVKSKKTDSLSLQSFSFDTYTAYIKTNDQKKNKYGLTFFTRSDKYPLQKELVKGDRSYNVNFNAELLQSEKHQLLFNTTYRQLKVFNKDVSKQNSDRTVLGRTEYLINEWNGLVTGNVLYELGTGQEQRRDFAYYEVPAGQGEYAWIDYNNDNIQQLNEFEVAQFQDQAKFIRIFIPTNEFVKANYNTLNYSFALNPKAYWNKPDVKGIAAFLTRFSWQTSMQKNKKSVAKTEVEFNPFKYAIQDTALITMNTSFLNTLSFNRYSTKWGIDVSNVQHTGKALLTYGYESRQQADWIAKLRYNLSRDLSVNVLSKKGTNILYTPNFENRNYELDILNTEPQLVFIKGTAFRLQTSYKLEEKQNSRLYGGQKSLSSAVNVETKYNVVQNSSLNARFTLNTISYTDVANNNKANTTVSYIMLDGLLPGKNFLWSADLTRRLLNNVEVNFQYEGRKPGVARTVHTGRASLRALF
ncbi:MAG TPA: hypothetical protein VEZ55_12515 [Chitinophagaceae bacterium]|nr:hypothetical protein [Chitinophagaceae bacterium]